MIINRQSLLDATPILDMTPSKLRTPDGVSFGLAEIGYDIRLKQTVIFTPGVLINVQNHLVRTAGSVLIIDNDTEKTNMTEGNFVLASAMEYFKVPTNLGGIVHDKSTWARKGLSVFNTVIEPGWSGWLTLELVYHGNTPLKIDAGTGIAQVIFHEVKHPAQYDGSYQNQCNEPVASFIQSERQSPPLTTLGRGEAR